jgi:pimeloyl-ACP methyl ester carboxylesterase
MYLIKRRLEREYGMRVWLFSYPSVRDTLDDNAAALARFIHQHGLESTHIIGHSLGGVVALRMLANDPDAVPGRLVCMGSPLSGSRVAALLNEQVWAERMVGPSLLGGVIHAAANEWGNHVCARREVGIIAGTMSFGVGQFVAKFDEPNDGTIALSETRLEGAKDHLVMSVSHTGMLVSADVADQAAAFLRRGRFLRDEP